MGLHLAAGDVRDQPHGRSSRTSAPGYNTWTFSGLEHKHRITSCHAYWISMIIRFMDHPWVVLLLKTAATCHCQIQDRFKSE